MKKDEFNKDKQIEALFYREASAAYPGCPARRNGIETGG